MYKRRACYAGGVLMNPQMKVDDLFRRVWSCSGWSGVARLVAGGCRVVRCAGDLYRGRGNWFGPVALVCGCARLRCGRSRPPCAHGGRCGVGAVAAA